MEVNMVCPSCSQELTGAIEIIATADRRETLSVHTETSDCNWTSCTGCGSVMCKTCRRDRSEVCCSIWRRVDEEMALVQSAHS